MLCCCCTLRRKRQEGLLLFSCELQQPEGQTSSRRGICVTVEREQGAGGNKKEGGQRVGRAGKGSTKGAKKEVGRGRGRGKGRDAS